MGVEGATTPAVVGSTSHMVAEWSPWLEESEDSGTGSVTISGVIATNGAAGASSTCAGCCYWLTMSTVDGWYSTIDAHILAGATVGATSAGSIGRSFSDLSAVTGAGSNTSRIGTMPTCCLGSGSTDCVSFEDD